MAFPINPPRIALVDKDGRCSPEWYVFFLNIQQLLGTSSASPFDDSTLIAVQPVAPPAVDASAEALLAAAPTRPIVADDPLIPPAMPVPAWDDLMNPYRLPPGA